MENNHDHRENNKILAKSLNEARVNLREKNHNIAALKVGLREEQLKRADINCGNARLFDQIDDFKRQLDETFIRNTIGYMNLSIKIETIQKTAMDNMAKFDAANAIERARPGHCPSYHSNIQVDPNAFKPTARLDRQSLNSSNRSTANPNENVLDSTFSFGSSGDESALNTTFLCTDDDSDLDRMANVTIRRNKTSYMRETESSSIKKVARKSVGSMAMEALKSVVSSRGRTVKKVNYNELSVGQQYSRYNRARKWSAPEF